jgi:hypothetical protein
MAGAPSACPWLLAAEPLQSSVPMLSAPDRWTWSPAIQRPTDKTENVLLYKKAP